MAKDTQLKEGTDFTELTVDLENNINELCSKTYKATKKPLPEADAKALLDKAEAQIAEYEKLVSAYTGGRRESIVSAGTQIVMLKQFATALRAQLDGR